MRFLGFDDNSQPPLRTVHTGPKLTDSEGRQIFREMVRSEARDGQLSDRRRRRLIQYAAALNLKPLEASRIVTEVCQEEAVEVLDAPALYRFVETAAEPAKWPAWVRIALPLAAAFAVHQLFLLIW